MPSIKKMKSGNYSIMVSMGYGMDGRQKRCRATFKPPKGVVEGTAERMAAKFAYKFERTCQESTGSPGNMKFTELCDWYFTKVAPNIMKKTTVEYEWYVIKMYVYPLIGSRKISKITTLNIDSMLEKIETEGRLRVYYVIRNKELIPKGTRKTLAESIHINRHSVRQAGNGRRVRREVAEKIAAGLGMSLSAAFEQVSNEGDLSVSTINRIRATTGAIFNSAVKKGLTNFNPVSNSTLRKEGYKEKTFLDEDQCKELLTRIDELNNPNMKVGLKLMIYTGMRPGEVCGLKWDYVDLKNGLIKVRHTAKVKNGKHWLDTPKTLSSNRDIPMPKEAVEMLRAHKLWQDIYIDSLGTKWIDADKEGKRVRNSVIASIFGEYLHTCTLNQALERLLKKYPEFPKIHLHDLRHANASILINRGVPLKIVSEHLGHSSTRVTEEVYVHLFRKYKVVTAQAIQDAFGDETKNTAIDCTIDTSDDVVNTQNSGIFDDFPTYLRYKSN